MLVKYRSGDILTGMDWPNIIETLRKRGWTQALLADRLGIAQSAVSDLSRGSTKDPKHSTGRVIEELLASGETPPSAAPADEAAEPTKAAA